VSLETNAPAVNTAIILLAGNDPRYIDETERVPCGLLEVNGFTLLQFSVERLLQSGFAQIIVITGQWSRPVQNLAHLAHVKILYDALFADFGSMFALRRVASQLNSYPFVLLESGILFESRLALLAKTMPYANGVVVSNTRSRDSGLLARGVNGRLLILSNEGSGPPAADASNTSQALGVYKISRPMFAEMLTYATQRTYTDPFMDYIDAINGVASTVDVHLVPAPDLLWTQIRSRPEMVWAFNHIYPRIMQQEEQAR